MKTVPESLGQTGDNVVHSVSQSGGIQSGECTRHATEEFAQTPVEEVEMNIWDLARMVMRQTKMLPGAEETIKIGSQFTRNLTF